MNRATDARAEAALLTMQRNREQLLAAYAPAAEKPDQFPRSATFRWLTSHLTGGSVVSTLLSAAVFRSSWLHILGRLVGRRGARQAFR
jgi:hypothetical protein